jgi:hypothetical protein
MTTVRSRSCLRLVESCLVAMISDRASKMFIFVKVIKAHRSYCTKELDDE